MTTIAYTRVSTNKQEDALDNQIEIILDFIEKNKLNLSNIITEVGSAYYPEQTQLEKLLELQNITIIVSDISRFSRNVVYFNQFYKKMVKNNIKLISIKENIICNFKSNAKYEQVLELVKYFQNESVIKITNIKNKKNIGWDFRQDRFGKKVIFQNNIRKLVDNDEEAKVIELIKALKRETKVSIINKYLKKVLPNNPYPIELLDTEGKVTADLRKNNLDFNTIANLLNSYNIFNRGKKWNINSINKVMKFL